jgi:hypothetical protein
MYRPASLQPLADRLAREPELSPPGFQGQRAPSVRKQVPPFHPWRRAQRFGYAPTSPQPLDQHVLPNAQIRRPVLQAHSLAAVGQVAGRTLVSGLVLARHPVAVCGLVVTVVVATFDLESRRTRSHVAQECLERTPPPSAHANPPTAVPVVSRVVWVVAALAHVAPAHPLASAGPSMRSLAHPRSSPSQASAACGSAALQAGTVDGALCPASALAPPKRPAVTAGPQPCAVQAQDVPGTEVLVGQVSEVGCTHLEIPGALGARLYHGGTP